MLFLSKYILKCRRLINFIRYTNRAIMQTVTLLIITIFIVHHGIIKSVWADPSAQQDKESVQLKELNTKTEKTQGETVCEKQVNPLLKKNQKVLNVTGMVCAFCVQGIEIHLKKLSSIKEVNVDLEQGKVLLSVKPSQSPSSADLCEAINRAGYTVTTIEYAP